MSRPWLDGLPTSQTESWMPLLMNQIFPSTECFAQLRLMMRHSAAAFPPLLPPNVAYDYPKPGLASAVHHQRLAHTRHHRHQPTPTSRSDGHEPPRRSPRPRTTTTTTRSGFDSAPRDAPSATRKASAEEYVRSGRATIRGGRIHLPNGVPVPNDGASIDQPECTCPCTQRR